MFPILVSCLDLGNLIFDPVVVIFGRGIAKFNLGIVVFDLDIAIFVLVLRSLTANRSFLLNCRSLRSFHPTIAPDCFDPLNHTMKYALVKLRVHLLVSKPFVIYTDHASLYTATQLPHLSQIMALWLSFFAEYNFEMKYKPGKQNALADALSRRLDYELSHVTTLSSSAIDLIRAAYA